MRGILGECNLVGRCHPFCSQHRAMFEKLLDLIRFFPTAAFRVVISLRKVAIMPQSQANVEVAGTSGPLTGAELLLLVVYRLLRSRTNGFDNRRVRRIREKLLSSSFPVFPPGNRANPQSSNRGSVDFETAITEPCEASL